MLSSPLLASLRASSPTFSNAQTWICIRRAMTQHASTVRVTNHLAQCHYRVLSTQRNWRRGAVLISRDGVAWSSNSAETARSQQDGTLSKDRTVPPQGTAWSPPIMPHWKIIEPRVPEFEAVADTLALPNVQSASLQHLERSPLPLFLRRLLVALKNIQFNWPRVEADKSLSFPLLLDSEWAALSQVCLDVGDARLANTLLSLMKHSGATPSNEQCDKVLDFFVSRGLVAEADAHVARFSSNQLREHQSNSLIQARLRAGEIEEACKIFRRFSELGFPLPLESYSSIIGALLDNPQTKWKIAEAWGVFAHMRDTTNHTPNARLYHMMLRRAQPGPQTALDLFHEMTIDRGIMPDRYAYTGVIRACASSREFTSHAIRLARELVQAYREALGVAKERLRPTYGTLASTMEAAANSGDLSLVRSVLGMLEQYAQDTGSASDEYAQKAMHHMFKAYSLYVPPSAEPEKALGQPNTNASVETQENSDLPQSHEEVSREVTLIWERITAPLWMRATLDTKVDVISSLVSFRITPDPQLVNSYMWVHYHHSSPSQSFEVFNHVSKSMNLQSDADTYVLALEAYANYKCSDENEALSVLTIARKLWEHWKSLKESRIQYSGDLVSRNRNGRLSARAYMAMIRNLTNARNFGEAEDLLRAFVVFSPPQSTPAAPWAPSRPEQPPFPIIRDTQAESPWRAQTESRDSLLERSQRYIRMPRYGDIAGLKDHAFETHNKSLLDFLTWVMDAYTRGSSANIRSAYLRKFRGSPNYP